MLGMKIELLSSKTKSVNNYQSLGISESSNE